MRIPNHRPDALGSLLGRDALRREGAGTGDLHIELPLSGEAPRIARSALDAWAEELPLSPWRLEKLRLLASEVVSNAVMHSGASADSTICLVAVTTGRDVLVTVTDAGIGSLPRLRSPHPLSGGYGLHVIKAEARRWGVERAEGTRVWFTV